MPSNIPAPRVPFLNNDGTVRREWFRYLQDLGGLTGSGDNQVSLADLQLAPVDSTGEVSQLVLNDKSTQSSISLLNTEIAILAGEIVTLQTSVTTLNTEVTTLNTEVSNIQTPGTVFNPVSYESGVGAFRVRMPDISSTGSSFSFTAIPLQTVDYDLLNEWDIATNTWTVVNTGLYFVEGYATWYKTNNQSKPFLALYVNASFYCTLSDQLGGNDDSNPFDNVNDGTETGMQMRGGSTFVALGAGDTVQLMGKNYEGSVGIYGVNQGTRLSMMQVR